MKIHALTTGTVSLKRAFLYPRGGLRRQVDLFLPGPFSEPMPIHCWAIEHDGRLVLVDTGETTEARDIAMVRFHVRESDELPHQAAAAGVSLADVDTVVLTHLHGDHMHGAVHLDRPVLVHDDEIAFQRTVMARISSRIGRQPVPKSLAIQPLTLDDGPFGAFAKSKALTADGRIVAVATPGHTLGHISVVCVDDDGRHVLLAGDATDSLEQLHARRPDAVGPKPKVMIETMGRILEHGRKHPTVYLPAHDPDTVARLEARTLL